MSTQFKTIVVCFVPRVSNIQLTVHQDFLQVYVLCLIFSLMMLWPDDFERQGNCGSEWGG